jgi:MOSC domain-containing protein YiiM
MGDVRVVWIGLAPAKKADLVAVETAFARVDGGFDGEHHGNREKKTRQATFIAEDALAHAARVLGREVTPSMTRRNVVLSGVDPMIYDGRRFRIGGAVFEGTGPCDPCQRMEQNLGTGGKKALEGRGGLTARVVEDGEIRVGDRVVPVE